MILVIDNYDSFVHNLARYVRELGESAIVRRNDSLSLDDVAALAPTHIIVSPGPCTPREAGISTELIRRFGPTVPVLGVCLGHQCIGAAFGGDVVRAGRPVHGKTSSIRHTGTGIFAGLPSPLTAARYHSLVIERSSLPSSLRVTATSEEDDEIMAVEHVSYPVIGVQFHPESAISEYGYALLDRFLHGATARTSALPVRADGAREAPRGSWWRRRMDQGPGGEFVPPPVELVR